MRRESEAISAGREGNCVNPTSGVVQVLSTDGVEGQSLTPGTGLRSFVGALDEAGEDSRMRIRGTSSKKDRVGVPGDAGDGAADGLLQVLRDPPIVLLLEVADGNDTIAGADGKLGFVRRPAHKGRGPADSQQDQGRLVTGGRGFPNESITV